MAEGEQRRPRDDDRHPHLRAVPSALPHRPLDLDVDGGSTVVESDSMPAPISESNPFGLDLHTQATVIRSRPRRVAASTGSVSAAGRCRTEQAQRLGRARRVQARAVGIVPAMFDESSPILKRNPVIGKTLWVTRHHDDQFWPAGDYRRRRSTTSATA
jgi:primary-amine oxidase